MSSNVLPIDPDKTALPAGSETDASGPDGQAPVIQVPQPGAGANVPVPATPPQTPAPLTPAQIAEQTAAFDAVLKSCRALKEQYVDIRISYYKDHTKIPRWMFRIAGVMTILLSVTLPALAAAVLPYKELILSAVSIAIAALTGLSSFYRWDRTWSGNSSAQVALEQHVAKWELELTNAQYVVPFDQRILHAYQATNDLLINARSVVSSESSGFFSGLQFPQQNSTSKT
jgi:Protein of unknown function (DUF4231)